MKQVMKTLVVVGAMVAAGSAAADLGLGDVRYSLGVDFQQNWMKAKSGYDSYFPKSFPGANVYVGAKFNENFGVEVGGDFSTNKKKNWTVTYPAGNALAGTTTGTSKIRRSGYHLDLVGSLPLNECFDLTASVGYGYTKAKLSQSNVAHAANAAAVNYFNSFSSKGKSLFRLGVGGNYQVTEMFGVRAKLGWEGTSRLRLNTPTASAKAFKDTVSLALGVFARF